MKNMKKITSALLLSAVAGSAFAANEGFYVAVNAG
jgi:opacity protein-like surface antigen